MGTDGRQPHTFVEHGPEARWDEEKNVCFYFTKPDLLQMFAVSVGDAKIDDFEVTIRVTPPNTKPKVVNVKIGAGKERSTGGADHIVEIPDFKKKFPASDPNAKMEDYLIEAYFPEELGGDRYNQNLAVAN